MAKVTEYQTSNRRIRYPFADDSVLYSAESSDSSNSEAQLPDSLARIVFGSFTDALVQFKSPYVSGVPTLTNISLGASTLNFSLKCPSTGCETVNLTCSRAYSTYFPVIKGECSWCWYVFVLSYEGIREFGENSEKIGNISYNSLDFSPKCIGRPAESVNSIWIYGGEQGKETLGRLYTRQEAMLHDPDVIVTGDAVVKPGYNMRYLEEDSGFSLNATPGAGMGVAPCGCTDDSVEFKTPGLISPEGHSRVFNDTCYDLVPNVESRANGQLYMHVKCKSCCTCEMYEDIVTNRLIPLRDRLVAARSQFDGTLSTYERNVALWNTRIATAIPDDIVVTSTAVPLDAAATDLDSEADVNGKMCRCGYSVTMRNDSFVSVKFTLDSFLSNGTPFEAQVSYMKSSTNPVIFPVDLTSEDEPIFSVTLAPGRSAVLTFFVRLNWLVKTDRRTGYIAELKVSAYQGTRYIVSRYENLGKMDFSPELWT